MSESFLRYDVDLDKLTDAMWAFVTDPRPSRNERPVVKALNDVHPDSVDVLESMLLDGTEDRADVAAYVEVVFGSLAATQTSRLPSPMEDGPAR
jgi:hypothetical protein